METGIFNLIENTLPVKYYNSLDARGTSISMLFNLWKDIKDADIIYIISIFSFPTPLTIFPSKVLKKKIVLSPRGQLGIWCLEQGNTLKEYGFIFLLNPLLLLSIGI